MASRLIDLCQPSGANQISPPRGGSSLQKKNIPRTKKSFLKVCKTYKSDSEHLRETANVYYGPTNGYSNWWWLRSCRLTALPMCLTVMLFFGDTKQVTCKIHDARHGEKNGAPVFFRDAQYEGAGRDSLSRSREKINLGGNTSPKNLTYQKKKNVFFNPVSNTMA